MQTSSSDRKSSARRQRSSFPVAQLTSHSKTRRSISGGFANDRSRSDVSCRPGDERRSRLFHNVKTEAARSLSGSCQSERPAQISVVITVRGFVKKFPWQDEDWSSCESFRESFLQCLRCRP